MTDVRRAFQLHQEGRLEEADRLYREALAHDPGDANALHLFGVLQGQRADFEAAADFIGRSIALEPKNPMAFYNRGNALRELKRLDEALLSFDQAVAMMPAHVEAWTNRGTVLQELGRSAEALVSFDRALALTPLHVTALFNRANALRHLKRQTRRSRATIACWRSSPIMPRRMTDVACCSGVAALSGSVRSV